MIEKKNPVDFMLANAGSLRVALSESERSELLHALEGRPKFLGVPREEGGITLLNVAHIVRIDLPKAR